MNRSDRQAGTSDDRIWQPRFTLASAMLVMLVCSVTAAAGSYLIRVVLSDSSPRGFIMVTLAAPVVLVAGMNAMRLVLIWWQRRRR